MEFEEAHDNLCAIRLLYRLLEDNSVALQDTNSEHVVERARILLKSLLDVAVEVVFETHLKITATKVGISKTISDTGGTKSKILCILSEENGMNTMQQNLVKATNQSNEKGISPSIESDYHEQLQNGEHAKESPQMFDGASKDNNIPLRNDIHEAECNSSAARLVESLQQKGDFSDDLVNAIKRIESRILAFQLCSNLVDSTKNSAGHHPLHIVTNLESPKMERKDRAAGNQLSCRRSLLEGHGSMSRQTDKSSCKGENLISTNAFEVPFLTGNESLSQSQVKKYQHCGFHPNAASAKSVYIPKQVGTQLVSREALRSRTGIQPSAQNMAVMDRVKSLNRLVSGNDHLGSQTSECIQGLRIPLNQDDLTKKPPMFASEPNRDLTKKPPMFASQPNRESLVRKTPVACSKTNQKQKERSSESSHAQKLARSTPTIAPNGKPPPHQMVIKPTLLDQRSSKIKVNSHQHRDGLVLEREGIYKTRHTEPWKTKVPPQPHELEESSSVSGSSSHWTSQQGSTNSSNSDSEDSSMRMGTQGHKSGRMADAAYEGSSEESNDSFLYKDESSSRRVGSLNSYRHHRNRSPKKTIGGLKRLKNKLGLIFHHHHHHHHHHHNDDSSSIPSNAGHKHSMWNPLQNVFHHKNKHGVLTQKVEKTRRGTVTKVLPRSNQVGQFHRLVAGLVRHIRHSKKPKHGREKAPRSTPREHSQKKLHWWQILRCQRRGVKLKNRGRVKMGFVSQKSLKN